MAASKWEVLAPRASPGARVTSPGPGQYRLNIPAGPAKAYRVAQLDDYFQLPRRRFAWRPPFSFELRARVSARGLPGTWGFGFWNDPFSAGLGQGGGGLNLGALPNTAWFFHGSSPNYLSLRDDLPASGFLGAVFSSPAVPTLLLAPGLLAAPLLAIPPAARLLRRLARHLVKEDAAQLDIDPTRWHIYRLEINDQATRLSVDGLDVFSSSLAPHGPLGLVIWIDNQFAALTPAGRLASGSLANPDAWLEVELFTAAHTQSSSQTAA